MLVESQDKSFYYVTGLNLTFCAQVISQLRKNQLVRSRGKNIPLTVYFSRSAGGSTLIIRGGKANTVTMLAARCMVFGPRSVKNCGTECRG